ncbi:HalOD1 output domain-containing protein [Halohasta salina]|uniref:HalOD1 output domain-containing protein n=1 Tax=Halohasta salina TaxID=2961621 RepID=UPI0020A24669|nr:HalOD1 output domain-containing protein [Halohasta salina]
MSYPNTDTDSHRTDRTDRVSYLSDWRTADSAATAIVLSVADNLDCTPMALPALSTAVDPDALDTVLESGDESIVVSFSYAGCEVSLRGDGELVLR